MKRRYSIIQKGFDTCFLCGQYATDQHHCLHGSGRRKLADEDRLTVMLCHRCHMLLHDKGNMDRELQKIAQKTYMEHYHKTVQDFVNRYGKNYL